MMMWPAAAFCHLALLGLALLPTRGRANDVRQLLRRTRRNLVYPDPLGSETKVQVLFGLGLPMEEEVSMTLGYVIKCNYNLPHNASHFTRAPEERQHPLSRGSRWSLYRILEAAMGKSCLLRAVCEIAELPLHLRQGGLLAQLLQLALTPSATREDYELYADREYHAAEAKGRLKHDCSQFYEDCPYSPLDYFTRLVYF